MKKTALFLVVVGLLTIVLALPVSAAIEKSAPEPTAEAEETVDMMEMEELVIEEEDVPLAGLPGVSRMDVGRTMIGAGVVMIVVAVAILAHGARTKHARKAES